MPADGPARAALAAHGGIIVTSSVAEAIELANEAAAEHLVVDDDRMAARIRRAGSLFVGDWSAQVAGDYAIGCNHVLPTAGAARVRGGLSAADFVRQITVQRVTQKGLSKVGPSVITLARAEGLEGHAASIEVRLGPSAPGGRASRGTNATRRRTRT
jgi:histidinol dehydrogenase